MGHFQENTGGIVPPTKKGGSQDVAYELLPLLGEFSTGSGAAPLYGKAQQWSPHRVIRLGQS